jgi:hypothetical protein
LTAQIPKTANNKKMQPSWRTAAHTWQISRGNRLFLVVMRQARVRNEQARMSLGGNRIANDPMCGCNGNRMGHNQAVNGEPPVTWVLKS